MMKMQSTDKERVASTQKSLMRKFILDMHEVQDIARGRGGGNDMRSESNALERACVSFGNLLKAFIFEDPWDNMQVWNVQDQTQEEG